MEAKKILLAEDDPKDVELTLAALAEHNLANEVVVARDGAEALDYLYRRGQFADRPTGHPVVVLLDLKMPKVDGLEVLRQVKSDPGAKSHPHRRAHLFPPGPGHCRELQPGRERVRGQAGRFRQICGSGQTNRLVLGVDQPSTAGND